MTISKFSQICNDHFQVFPLHLIGRSPHIFIRNFSKISQFSSSPADAIAKCPAHSFIRNIGKLPKIIPARQERTARTLRSSTLPILQNYFPRWSIWIRNFPGRGALTGFHHKKTVDQDKPLRPCFVVIPSLTAPSVWQIFCIFPNHSSPQFPMCKRFYHVVCGSLNASCHQRNKSTKRNQNEIAITTTRTVSKPTNAPCHVTSPVWSKLERYCSQFQRISFSP